MRERKLQKRESRSKEWYILIQKNILGLCDIDKCVDRGFQPTPKFFLCFTWNVSQTLSKNKKSIPTVVKMKFSSLTCVACATATPGLMWIALGRNEVNFQGFLKSSW